MHGERSQPSLVIFYTCNGYPAQRLAHNIAAIASIDVRAASYRIVSSLCIRLKVAY
jgi:hypothetical protein